MAKIRFSLVCNIIAALCCAIVGFGNLCKGEPAGWLFIALFILQIAMIIWWIRKIRQHKKRI